MEVANVVPSRKGFPEVEQLPVVLIPCAKKKVDTPDGPVPPEELYISQLFQKALKYARDVLHVPDDRIFILSEEYFLLPLSQSVTWYEKSLRGLTAPQRKAWADTVWAQLTARFPNPPPFIILVGRLYYEYLVGPDRIPQDACELPLAHMSIGKQIQALTHAIDTGTPI